MMAMTLPPRPEPEYTIICIDNGRRALCNEAVYMAQIEGARFYCKTVLECNPENIVSILVMSSKSSDNFGQLTPPTSDLQQLQSALEYVRCPRNGVTVFERGLWFACSPFSSCPADMKKRLLMFVGGVIVLDLSTASSYRKKLKANGVALDVLNLFCLKVDKKASVFEDKYHYPGSELETLVSDVDADGNSQLVNIPDKYVTLVHKNLEFKLKEHLDYLKKTADEKKRSAEAARRKRRYLNKKAAAADDKNKIRKTKSAADEKNRRAEAARIKRRIHYLDIVDGGKFTCFLIVCRILFYLCTIYTVIELFI